MLFAVATPMHMMAPVSAGTLSVVPVINNIQAMPATAAGSAVMMMKAAGPGLEVDDDQHIHQHDRADEADREASCKMPSSSAPGRGR